MDIHIEEFTGDRESLRHLFELAEDSADQLAAYLHAGRVLVARDVTAAPVGHLQLVDTASAGEVELKNMAVREDLHGQGIGRRLVETALALLAREHARRLHVATGAADVGNLRFYQRVGFRMRAIERDAFTPATGYPDRIVIDGIELRDRVWLDRPVDQVASAS